MGLLMTVVLQGFRGQISGPLSSCSSVCGYEEHSLDESTWRRLGGLLCALLSVPPVPGGALVRQSSGYELVSCG